MLLRSTTCSIRLLLWLPRSEIPLCAGESLSPPAVPRGFTASSCGQTPAGVFCFPCLSRERIRFTPYLMFGPSPTVHDPPGTMPSADSCRFSHTSRCGLPVPLALRQASPGKDAVFPSIYPPHLLLAAFGSMDFALLCKLVQLPLASPGVRGPRAGGLPPASFRFRLATDTLAFG